MSEPKHANSGDRIAIWCGLAIVFGCLVQLAAMGCQATPQEPQPQVVEPPPILPAGESN
ncbi:MAG: hypothetical protein NXI04_22185 [Planctomycetaceae bacterium]|nr:hypothetical protein [Planctomycetaceae bacterium]